MSDILRVDGRTSAQLRPVRFTPAYVDYPEGSVLVEMGKTRVLCNVTIQESVPDWMIGRGQGWMTAEYAMLPRATHTRSQRETKGPSARSQEIKRLIGRSLRAAVDLNLLGERTLLLDCDVIQADGGTRTASITGGYVAIAIALKKLIANGSIPATALKAPIAAVSVGIVNERACLDLCYLEDSRAEVDMNVVMTAEGKYIEIQGTAEGQPFVRAQLDELTSLAETGIKELVRLQLAALT
ncbi:MAG: ribonuclease PH [Chloroflexi bacterium HGW-Chloroflexi-10]|nr:MAG: ribonuclease PH [Chloroflexi bacterium HGW-Chloroflexi-10]